MGFGVLTKVDVKATLKEKLDVDYPNYVILGICNPKYAHRALELNNDVGLFLPCKVVVRQMENEVEVLLQNPVVMDQVFDDPNLTSIMQVVSKVFEDIVEKL